MDKQEKLEKEMYELLIAARVEADIVLFSDRDIYVELGEKSIRIPWPDAEARIILMNDIRALAIFMLANLVAALSRFQN